MSKSRPRAKFEVSVEIPEGVSVYRLRQFLEAEAFGIVGSLHPYEDPLFDLDQTTVRAKYLGKEI
jgi:hypothetical protein